MRKFVRYKKMQPGGFKPAGLFLLLSWLSGGYSGLFAQSDTLTLLPEVLVRQQKAEKTGYAIWQADSLPSNGVLKLSERLYWDNSVDIRPNAPGTLATLSIRGAGPKRSPVLWNGLSLQSPMNGVVDLSLIPLWEGDRLEVRYGGQSAVQSSGSMGGCIQLQSQPFRQQSGFFGTATAAAGSWGRLENMFSTGWAGEKIASEVRASWQRADNDFPYRNFTQVGKPGVRQVNNFGEKWDVQQHNQWIINKKNIIKSSAWHQSAYREIPPTMTQTPQETWQRDRSTRAVASWEHRPKTNQLWLTRAAWLDEGIFFFLYGKTDSSLARTVLLSSDFSNAFEQHFLLKTGVQLQQQWANADGYTDSTKWYQQTRLAVYATGERRFKNGSLSLLLRQEWAQQQGAPFTWSLGGQFALGPGQLRFHLSRNFNLPTFNDRYWLDYGRADLRPERGYSSDLGWQYQQRSFSGEVSVFQLLLDDWIDWQPGSDGVFRPSNLKKVWSRGTALNGAWKWKKGGWNGSISGRYQYVIATNQSVYAGEQSVLNKQLVYTPNHSASFSLQTQYRRFSGAYLHQFTGPRFINSDNLALLKGFQTGQLLVKYALLQTGKKQKGLSLGLRVENIWNTPYQVLIYRPMPGRGWRLECSYSW